MRQPLHIFDQEADEVFASFIAQGLPREEALASTERYFLAQFKGEETSKKPSKMLEFASFARLFRPFMNISS